MSGKPSPVSKVRICYICAQRASTVFTRLHGDFEGFVVSGGWGGSMKRDRRDERRTLPLGPRPTSSSFLDQLQLEPFLVAKFPFVMSSLGPGHPPVSHLHAPVFSLAF